MQRAHLHASRLTRHVACDGSWRMEQDHGAGEVQGDDAKSGQLWHHIAELLFRERPFTAEIVAATFKADVEEVADAVEAMSRYTDEFECEAVESRLEKVVYIDDEWEIVLVGRIDMIARSMDERIVVDWKTGHGMLLDISTNMQAWSYAVLADVDRVEFVNPRLNIRRSLRTTKDQRREFLQKLGQLSKSWVKPRRSLSTGKHCDYCTARPHCPAWNRGLLDFRQQVADDAPAVKSVQDLQPSEIVEMYATVSAYEKDLKRAKEVLRSRIEEIGPIPTDHGTVLECRKTTRTDVPVTPESWLVVTQLLGDRVASVMPALNANTIAKEHVARVMDLMGYGPDKPAPKGFVKETRDQALKVLHGAGITTTTESTMCKEFKAQ